MFIIRPSVCEPELRRCSNSRRVCTPLQPRARQDKVDPPVYIRTGLVTLETAFLTSSMKFHPAYINLPYYCAVIKIDLFLFRSELGDWLS
jgi:hypothetical protein